MQMSASIIFIALAFGACNMFNDYWELEPDHYAEELLEDVIEHHTGISLDLTPDL